MGRYWFNCYSCNKKIKKDKDSNLEKICLDCRRRGRESSICLNCNSYIEPRKKAERGKQKKFCNLSCSSSYHNKGKVLSQEHREKISRNVSLNSPGFLGIKFYEVYSPYTESFIKLQGSWEYKYALFLNENEINWIKDRKYRIPYVDEKDCKRFYYPDFYLPDSKKFIEIKGFWTEKSKKKMELVINQNLDIDINILEGKDLIDLGIKVFDYPNRSNHRKCKS